MADQLRHYFHRTEGRGNHCVVEHFKRGALDYFFAYPEDYSRQSVEWVNGGFGIRPHHPAFEVIFIYSQQEGTLDIYFRGVRSTLELLQGLFATTILKLETLPPHPKDERVYDLSRLKYRDFEFIYSPESGIESVAVRKLRLSSRTVQGERLTLEADISRHPQALYKMIEKVDQSVNLIHYQVTQVEIAARVLTDADKSARTVPIRLTYPNSCSLKYDETGLMLREMLAASGIEPKAPQDIAPPSGA